uniref:Uncharacterized protein n=1 Tax=viral metagenome TaxID=1070528 RepID=A0A6M3LR10_9ZZZZ
MSIYERAHAIIVETLPSCKGRPFDEVATLILKALYRKRIAPVAMKASVEMFTRFHAHCRYLGQATGDGYEGVYNDAIEYAMITDDWPCKIVVREIEVAGETMAVDIQVPQSTTRATNAQLRKAYEYIEGVAKDRGVVLPEGEE